MMLSWTIIPKPDSLEDELETKLILNNELVKQTYEVSKYSFWALVCCWVSHGPFFYTEDDRQINMLDIIFILFAQVCFALKSTC